MTQSKDTEKKSEGRRRLGLSLGALGIVYQAVISGAFSVTRQAVQLGQCPRLHIIQTSAQERGQIYIFFINTLLMVSTIGLVIGFGSSSKLAGAYGMAVSATMLISTVLTFFVMCEKWRWPVGFAILSTAMFLVIDLAFFVANLDKLPEGCWFPLLVAGLVYIYHADVESRPRAARKTCR